MTATAPPPQTAAREALSSKRVGRLESLKIALGLEEKLGVASKEHPHKWYYPGTLAASFEQYLARGGTKPETVGELQLALSSLAASLRSAYSSSPNRSKALEDRAEGTAAQKRKQMEEVELKRTGLQDLTFREDEGLIEYLSGGILKGGKEPQPGETPAETAAGEGSAEKVTGKGAEEAEKKIKGAASIFEKLGFLFESSTWIRVGKVVAGGLIVLVGFWLLAKALAPGATGKVTKAAAAAAVA